MRSDRSPIAATLLLLDTAAGLTSTPRAQGQLVEPGQSFTGKVVQVTDGDTSAVDRPAGGVVTVRLWGVDAPETSQPYRTAATRGHGASLAGRPPGVRRGDRRLRPRCGPRERSERRSLPDAFAEETRVAQRRICPRRNGARAPGTTGPECRPGPVVRVEPDLALGVA